MSEKTDKLAKDLAEYFEEAGESRGSGPCACMGVECGQLACVAFWQCVLRDPKVLSEAMALYRNYKC